MASGRDCTRSNGGGAHDSTHRPTREISKIWTGPHPEDGSNLRVVDGPPEGGKVPEHPEEPQLTSPIGADGVDQGMLQELATRIFGKS